MSSHTTRGRYILAYHLDGDVVGAPQELEDIRRSAQRYNADDHAGGQWVVHELGPEVTT